MKTIFLLAGLVPLANLNMQSALEINEIFKQSEQVHQLTDLGEIRLRFLQKKEKLHTGEDIKP